ncbi:hypothetical protein BECAL_03154 [Bellilinea caldifistulae]|uniref:UDP-N-acetyl glucosamine 2-epimerase n=1 Tax=Bellilinea caldifistulae TaxID=360411 RepID=A0A0P6X1J6_9CHLR|nr:hypothetical protein [Bellilinea caldifistulae]KPL76287.1 hypothetical protein AC812_06320 [Bellilinea caldifistulae]GAP11955.1 hypothetical protein BECAL_03154 [Bellilinea caldifistulae]
MAKRILLIGGSLNQTMMMHKIAQALPEHECVFTPFYAEGLMGWAARHGLLDFTILGGRHRRETEAYLQRHHLPVDFGGQRGNYDLVVTCTDLIVQRNIRKKPIVLVQEGMTEPEGLRYQLVKDLRLPRWLANTAATGLSDQYEAFCVASTGYRDLFIRKGIRPEKIFVTGIPNYDNARQYLENDFPYRGYVLAATSASRETGKLHNRLAFLQRALQIADGRPLFIKLHPNENVELAMLEIKWIAPFARVFTDGNVHHMIANCDALVVENSTVIYTALALGKPVYAEVDVEQARRLLPLQNGGTSAEKIANVCRYILALPERKRRQVMRRYRLQLARQASHVRA